MGTFALRRFADRALTDSRSTCSLRGRLTTAQLAANICAQTRGDRPDFAGLVGVLVEDVRRQADALLRAGGKAGEWRALSLSIEAFHLVLRSARAADFAHCSLASAVWRLRRVAEELRLSKPTPAHWLPSVIRSERMLAQTMS